MNADQAHSDDDYGPFGRPLFDDPATRALSRVGVVDVGSNSVRMVVFDGAARSPAYFYNEKIMCGLGKGLAETGMLNPEGRVRAIAAPDRGGHSGHARGKGWPGLSGRGAGSNRPEAVGD
jgi:exopolyphosphatase / guanosine-5'-triphosphate,3'-diphosphate pyrophosphatase